MTRLRDTIDRTPEYVNFIRELKQFHEKKGTTLQAEPVLGGRRLDLYKIFQVVTNSGGFDEVTKNRGWKQVGDIFQFPSTCTNSAYILKGVYIRNLLGWEEEKLWRKDWKPPKELLGPGAHKSSTLAGKQYKTAPKIAPSPPLPTPIVKKKKKETHVYSNPLLFDFTKMDMNPPLYATIQDQLKAVETPAPQPVVIETTSAASSFSEKDRILFALQFGQREDVDWALNEIVHMSFECPEKLELTESPFLLQLLLSIAKPCLASHSQDNQLPLSATDTLNNMLNIKELEDCGVMTPLLIGEIKQDSQEALDIILKVLHILRNFSFLSNYIPILAKNKAVQELLVQGLESSMSTGHVELGRHSMDVLENIAVQMKLNQTDDQALFHCIYQLIAAHDRYLVIGSIRTLTWITIHNKDLTANPNITSRIAQMLLSNDEELVGTSLEYIYQYTKTSTKARLEFLSSAQSSAYIGLFISLLQTKSKYFNSKFIQHVEDKPTTKNDMPKIPDLTVYQNLDEPFRCLGWLKDKFEVANRSSVLSLDDIYLLYESRFGLEKALKMRDFYTVMKIAFPKTSTSSNTNKPLLTSPTNSCPSPVVEGLNILGIQIKMSILQDKPQIPCQWSSCSLLFDDTFNLQRHVLHDHMKPDFSCQWSTCNALYTTKDDWISHLRTHFYINDDYTTPAASPCPSTPSSTFSSVSSSSSISYNISDTSEIQGIALVAAHLLYWLSLEHTSQHIFDSYQKELTAMVEQRPKLSKHLASICDRFTVNNIKVDEEEEEINIMDPIC